MTGSQYETIKQFERRTDRDTRVVTSVAARASRGRVFFRVATVREHDLTDGTVRRSPWLGVREFVAKNELEKMAMDFIAEEAARRKAAGMTFTA